MPDAIVVAIFDLDDTLYDCLGQRVQASHFYASQAMVEAGVRASAEEIFRARMRAFADDPQLEHIDAHVCRQFKVPDPERVTAAARAAFYSMPVERLTLYPGALETLRELKQRGVRVFIVTFGDPATQHAKIAALGLQNEPAVERIFYADAANVLTKEDVFTAILRETGVSSAQVLVVGDRPNTEIRAGKRLGMRTVRIRRGEFSSLEPQGPDEKADWEIRDISSVMSLPIQFGAAPQP